MTLVASSELYLYGLSNSRGTLGILRVRGQNGGGGGGGGGYSKGAHV